MKIKFSLIIISILALASCMKKPAFEDSDGEQVSQEQYINTLLSAWGSPDASTIEKNEFAYIEREQFIQNNAPVLVFQQGISVLEKEDRGSDFLYSLAFQSNEITAGQSKISTDEVKLSVPKVSSLKTMSSSEYKYISVLVFQAFLTSFCQSQGDTKVSCFNLKISEELSAPPELVQKQESCGGINNCQIKMYKISFDQVSEYTDKSQATPVEVRDKLQLELFLSPDVPYLSRMMGYCYKGLYKIPNWPEKVLVKICDRVKNFKFGSP